MKRWGLIILCVVVGLSVVAATRGGLWDRRLLNVWTSNATGSAAMAITIAPADEFQLVEVRLTLDAASGTSENFTVTIDSALGSAYDHQLLSTDMNAERYVTWVLSGDEERFFNSGDELDFAWTNSNTKDWALEIKYRKLR